MQDEVIVTPTSSKRVPWNKGKLTGAKPPLRPKHVWAIRTKLRSKAEFAASRCSIWRSTASFVAAMSWRCRGDQGRRCRRGRIHADRATVRQKRSGRPVRFELSEET